MSFMYSLLICVCLSTLVLSIELPKSITPCHRSDPKISNCMKTALTQAIRAFENGSEEFNLKKIEPFYVHELILIQSKTNKNFHLSMSYQDLYMQGLSKVQFDNVKVTATDDKVIIEGDMFFPSLIMDSKYELIGKLLLFNLRGKDKAHLEMETMNSKVLMVLETDVVDGVKYFVLKDAKITTSAPKRTKLQFDNIIKGNPKLTKQMNKILEDNIEGLHDIFSPSIEAFFTSILSNAASKVFSIIPMDQLLPP